MLNRFFGHNAHTHLHVLGLSGIAFALCWSKVMMSISMMFIVLNLLLEADFKHYWKCLKSNRGYHLLLLFFLLHPISFLWSENLDYALHDFKAKLPIFVIPTIVCARPALSKKHLKIIFASLLAPLVATSLFNFASYQHWIGHREYDDIRGMSLFGSHIRYALLISIGAGISVVAAYRMRKYRYLFIGLFCWFAFYTLYSQVLSGAITFVGVLFIIGFYFLWQRNRAVALLLPVGILSAAGVLALWLLHPLEIDPVNYADLPSQTAEGNPYSHNLDFVSSETGNPILIFVCEDELKREWELRSDILYNGKNIKGDPVNFTLIRYMESKGLTKDAKGMEQLTNADIRDIEFGSASAHNRGIMSRLHSLRFEIQEIDNPNGHSLLQRFEYWKGAWSIALQHIAIGVGSGDVQDAFEYYYQKSNSRLLPENQHRAHSQFLTILLTFGIPGFLVFLFMLAYYFRYTFTSRQLIGLIAIAVIGLSFLMEDTLETQTGATLFGLFFGLHLPCTQSKESD